MGLILAVQGGWRGDWGVGWVWDKRLEQGQASSCCKWPGQVKPSARGGGINFGGCFQCSVMRENRRPGRLLLQLVDKALWCLRCLWTAMIPRQPVCLFARPTLSILLYHTTPRCTRWSQTKKTVIKWPVLPGRVTRLNTATWLGGSRRMELREV